jgi:comEA protein
MWTWLRSPRVQITAGLVAPVTLVALVLASRVPDALPRASLAGPPATTAPAPAPRPSVATISAPAVKVYVSGAVAYPGVYALLPTDRVEDALRAAGGAVEEADLSRLNLAQRVRDEQQIHVPSRPNPNEPAAATTEGADDEILDLNRATLAQLDALPGVGPVTAKRILDYRAQHGPFALVEDLRTLKLVPNAAFEKIKDRLVVR